MKKQLSRSNVKKVALISLVLMFFLPLGCRIKVMRPAGEEMESVSSLIKKLENEDTHVRNDAVKELVKIGGQAVGPLIGSLSDENVLVRCNAAIALGKIGDKRTVEPLINMLDDENESVRKCAVFSLGEIGDREVVEPLIKALGDKDEEVRRYATEALGKIDKKKAVEPLTKALDDDSEDVRKGAAYVLENMFGIIREEVQEITGEVKSFTNSYGMEFIYIPPGTFMMGSPINEFGRDKDEKQHRVTLTKGFYMQVTEVIQGHWMAVMGNSPSYISNCGDNCPVKDVSWDDAQKFVRQLNQLEGENNYRLPTEAEWEYACRAGSTTAFANGVISELECGYDPRLDAIGWYCGNVIKKTHPVAQKNPNAWGLYDMHGNVFEWCQDWYGDYPSGSVTDPTGPLNGSYRVFRGGGLNFGARLCRSADRLSFTPGYRLNYIGFRILSEFLPHKAR